MAATAGGGTVAADFDGPGAASAYAGDAAFHRFYALLSPPGDRGTPAVFVHQLRTPDGQPRLVVVQAYTYDFGGGGMDTATTLTLLFQARVFRPGGPGRAPVEVLAGGGGSVVVAVSRPAKVFAGQCDPADLSHFSFAGVMHDEPFAIDGWLQADETVTMQLRNEPRITPAPRPGTPRRTVGP
jgi:hypothetical protein